MPHTIPDPDRSAAMCRHCLRILQDGEITLCVSCAGETVTCRQCRGSFPRGECRVLNSERAPFRSVYACRTCTQLIEACTHCDTHYLPNDSWMQRDGSTVCHNCGFNEYGGAQDDDDEYRDDDERDDDERDNGCINGYDYTPYPMRFYRRYNGALSLVTDATPRLYFGVELEIEAGSYSQRDRGAEYLSDTYPSYAKEDGSLGAFGWEQVSYPITPDGWAHIRPAITAALRKLAGDGCRSYEPGTCGLHVHLSRNAFAGETHVFKFLSLVYHHPAFWTALSGRRRDQLENWATFDCDISELPRKASRSSGCDFPRYSVINTQGNRTIEMRLFRGTLSPVGFYRCLQAVQALFDFSYSVSLGDCYSLPMFKRFVLDRKKAYPDFASWIVSRSPLTD